MSASLETPLDSRFLSEPVIASHPYPPGDESIDVSSDLDKDWVMRESMNGGVQHMKVLPTWGKDANQGSSPTKRIPVPSSDIMGTKAMRPREERRGSEDRLPRRPPALDLELGSAPGTPYVPPRCPNPPKAPVGVPSPSLDGTMTGRSVATELRLRIQRERERTSSDSDIHARCSPGSPAEAKRLSRTAYRSETPNDSERSSGHGVAVSKDEINEQLAGNESRAGSGSSDHTEHNSSEGPQESEISTVLETPQPSKEMTFTAPSPPLTHETLLASPLPLDDGFLIDAWKKSMSPPNLIPPPPPTHSPSLSPNVPITAWSPGSPASPHSIAATRQAVEAVRQTSEGKRPRGMTLVGRMEADLRASKGPVPITFLVGDPSTPTPRIGLGLPSTLDRITPEQRRATTPTRADPPMPEDIKTIRDSPSRFPPVPVRSVTSPDIIPQVPVTIPAVPKPGFFPARPRSRSFSATVARTFTKGRKESTPPLSIDTSTVPPVPAFTAAQSSKRSFFSKASPSTPGSPARPLPGRSSTTSSAITQPPPITSSMHSNDSIPSLALPSARSSSFSFSSKSSKPPRNVSRSLANPVSHKDFEETVQADGMDFELVKPTLDAPIDNRLTIVSGSSSGSFRAPLPETDEWGFLKEKSPTPEIFQSRSAPGDHRIAEQKWVWDTLFCHHVSLLIIG